MYSLAKVPHSQEQVQQAHKLLLTFPHRSVTSNVGVRSMVYEVEEV